MSEHLKYPGPGEFLKDKISDIQKKNKRVSIRSICLKVGISSGRMTDLLHGNRPLSSYYAEKLTEGLRLNRKERDILFSFVGTTARKKVFPRILLEDEMKLISGWENYAILSLLNTRDFKSSEEWIAERLGISRVRVAECLNLMMRMNLLARRGGEYARTSEHLDTTNEIPSKALQEAHRQDLKKAMELLGQTPARQRDYSSLTMAVDIKKIPHAKKMIGKFQDKLISYLESGDRSEVYSLCTQFFPLTKIKEVSDV